MQQRVGSGDTGRGRCEAIQARLALGHDLRLEAAVAIAQHLDLDRPIPGQHRLAIGSITVVAGPPAVGIALLIAEMVRQLGAFFSESLIPASRRGTCVRHGRRLPSLCAPRAFQF